MSLYAESSQSDTRSRSESLSVSLDSSKRVPIRGETRQLASKLNAESAAAETGVGERFDVETLYAEDLAIGDYWVTSCRRITEGDVHRFAELTGDHTPLHGAESESPFRQPVAHGLLGLSILAGLGTNFPKTSTLALVGIEDWQFLKPVFFGDLVKAKNEITAIERHGRRAIKVRWLRQLLDETDRVLQQGCFVTLVGSQSRTGGKPR